MSKDKKSTIFLVLLVIFFLAILITLNYNVLAHRRVEQVVARRAHNPEVAGSSPVPAPTRKDFKYAFAYLESFLFVATKMILTIL